MTLLSLPGCFTITGIAAVRKAQADVQNDFSMDVLRGTCVNHLDRNHSHQKPSLCRSRHPSLREREVRYSGKRKTGQAAEIILNYWNLSGF